MNIENFSQAVVSKYTSRDIATEHVRRPYVTSILTDELTDSTRVSILSMTGKQLAVMPVINDGQPPVSDSLMPFSLHEVSLMHYWVECGRSHHTFLQLRKKLHSMRGSGATDAQIQSVIDAMFTGLYSDRIDRKQDLEALQLCQVLSNISSDGTTYSGFNTTGWIHNDKYQYLIDGLQYSGEVFPTNTNPAIWLLNNLVDNSRGAPNEIWVGTKIRDWFLSWEGWRQYNLFQQPQRFMLNVDGVEVPAKGASLLYEIEGIRIICIDYKVSNISSIEDPSATDTTLRYPYQKYRIFNENAAVCLNTNTLGSLLYSPPQFDTTNPITTSINMNEKLNFYKSYNPKHPEKDSVYRSEGFSLAAVKDLSSIVALVNVAPSSPEPSEPSEPPEP